jgi:hypothetical protein
MEIDNFLKQDASDILRLPFTFKKWQIKPLTVAQMIKINPILVKILLSDIDNLDMDLKDGKLSKLVEFQTKYINEINDIITAIIGEDISEEINSDELMTLFLAIIYRMGGQSFPKSISLILKLSLQTKAGLIAAQERMKKSMTLPDLS